MMTILYQNNLVCLINKVAKKIIYYCVLSKNKIIRKTVMRIKVQNNKLMPSSSQMYNKNIVIKVTQKINNQVVSHKVTKSRINKLKKKKTKMMVIASHRSTLYKMNKF